MSTLTYKDCAATWTEHGITIGNKRIERRFQWTEGGLVCTAVVDKLGKHTWERAPLPEYSPDVSYGCTESDNDGLSSRHLRLTATVKQGGGLLETVLCIYPQLPFVVIERRCRGICPIVTTQAEAPQATGNENAVVAATVAAATLDTIDNVPLNTPFLKLRAVKLYDRTDSNDCLVSEEKFNLYTNGKFSFKGNVFLFDDYYQAGLQLMLVKDAPTHLYTLTGGDDSLRVQNNRNAELVGTGLHGDFDADGWCLLYGSTVGVGTPSELLKEYRRLYRAQYLAPGFHEPFIMSNTWGDRSQDSRVCEEFMLKEIETGARLGIDIIQIDDGWQKGATVNSKVAKGGIWEGYYSADQDFWQVNPQRFPHGLEPLVKKAAKHSIRFGLWFSPDSSHEFANWQRDVQTILDLHRTLGISSFKLDGVNLLTKKAENNYFNLLTAVERESRNRIALNLDCTAQNRPGYLLGKQFGSLFVENRYTDWSNYYPHNTLKNLWMLSQYLPPRKFQFELLNNLRNPHKYPQNDLCPAAYDINYEFASVMVANPLVWMEMSNLNEHQIQSLQNVIAVYRKVRKDFFNADIYPIGQQPDGCSCTGFQIADSKNSGYLLLFRETPPAACRVAGYDLPAPLPASCLFNLLATNLPAKAASQSKLLPESPSRIVWTCAHPRTFALYKYNRG